jgi:heme A synthase
MTLTQFKNIYRMEHYHRVYGRCLGLAIILPSIFFSMKNWVSPRNKKFLAASSALVVFQVFMRIISNILYHYFVGSPWLVHG